MSTSNNSQSSGIGFCGLLTIVFIALKLTHYIDWSWWWVLSPLYIPIAIILVVILVVVILRVTSISSPRIKQEKKKSVFAARLEEIQAEQERMRKEMK